MSVAPLHASVVMGLDRLATQDSSGANSLVNVPVIAG
jgi:hypothetical protein